MRVADYKLDDAASWCGVGCELRELPAENFIGALERVEHESVGASERRSLKVEPATYAPRSSRSRGSKRS